MTIKRRNGENLRIGTYISSTLQEVKGNQVKLGFHVPSRSPRRNRYW
ncbi:carbon storage regulator [Microbulbifer sp. ANSA001]